MSKAHIVGIGVCVYVRAGVRVREVGTPRIIHIILSIYARVYRCRYRCVCAYLYWFSVYLHVCECVFSFFLNILLLFSLSLTSARPIVGGYPRSGAAAEEERESVRDFLPFFFFRISHFFFLSIVHNRTYPYGVFFSLSHSLTHTRTHTCERAHESRSLLPARGDDGPKSEFRQAPTVVARTDAAERWAGAHRDHRIIYLFHSRIHIHAHL